MEQTNKTKNVFNQPARHCPKQTNIHVTKKKSIASLDFEHLPFPNDRHFI